MHASPHLRVSAGTLLVICAVPLGGCRSGESFKPLLPGIQLDRAARCIAVDGEICLEDGILEYVAVTPEGKAYESLVALHCRPAHLQQALLMAGYAIGAVPPEARGDYIDPTDEPERAPAAPPAADPPEDYWAARQAAPEARVQLQLEVQAAGGEWQRYPVERFLTVRGTDATPGQLTWIFTGSYFESARRGAGVAFTADITGSIIALWYDPSAVLNLAEGIGNPYRGEATGLRVREAVVPPAKTPIRLILRPGA